MKLGQMITDSFSGLVNYVTGTGTARDKITHARWQFARPQDEQLIALYRSTWIARKLVDVPIADMLRQRWRWQASDDDITKLEDEERRLGLTEKLRLALTRDAIYGGAALILGDGASDTSQPISPEGFGLGDLQYLIVSGRGELAVRELVRTPGPDYGQPAMFQLTPLQGPVIRIHPSRVITFNSMPIPAPLSQVGEEDFWGDSRLASVLRDIAAAMSGVAGAGRLMEELAVTYHKMAGFTERMADVDGEEQVRRVIDLMSQMKSSVQSVAIDAEDDIEVITANFAGLPDALRSLMQNVAGAGDMPLTRFLGSSPDGMNSTGASDIRNYYDRLAGQREAYVSPGILYLDQFLIPSALGRNDEDTYRIWNPLWQMSETEQVDLDAKKLKIMGDLSTGGLVHDHVVEQVTRTMMIESPTFQGAETAFEEADAMPEPDPDEVAAANELQAAPTEPPAPGQPRLRVVGDTAYEWVEDAPQPRVPAGSPRGGQWVKVGSGSSRLRGGGASEDEMFAVRDYMENASELNHNLRRGITPRYLEDQVEALDSLISRSQLTKDTDLYRGLTPEAFNAIKPQRGKEFTDDAFVSTSRSKRRAQEFSENAATGEMGYTMRLFVRKGAKAAEISELTGDTFEQEVLLPRGQRFKVMEVNEARREVYVHAL